MLHLASWNPILVFVCTAVGIGALLSAFVLGVTSYLDRNEKRNPRLVSRWVFPPKEGREARRERWGKSLGIFVKPVTPLVEIRPCELTLQQVIAQFEKAKEADGGVANLREGSDDVRVDLGCIEKEGEFCNLLSERERIRGKILKVLMKAGPPKQLCPISEKQREEEEGEVEAEEVEACSLEKTEPFLGAPSQPLILSEEILTVGEVGVSREVLWAALASLNDVDPPQPLAIGSEVFVQGRSDGFYRSAMVGELRWHQKTEETV